MGRTDVLTADQRRLCMSRNRGKDTQPEVRLRKACFALGLRYKLDYAIPGKPDFVFPQERVAVFMNGCFWHGCPQHYKFAKTRPDFWARKLEKNRQRDELVNAALREQGWWPLRVWEHEVRASAETAARRVRKFVLSARRKLK
jgi:DNA mismatch endonuclease, patch repair protein